METEEGNGETQQNPFSLDAEWKESDHPRKENGQFGEGGGSSNKEFEDEEQHEKDMQHSYKAQEDNMILLAIDYAEFKDVCGQINKLRDTKYKGRKIIVHQTPGFIYFVKNNGFNNYEFYDKIIYDEDKRKDWD